jgi:hypothetical protein
MGIYIEALILYIVLFFSGSAAALTGGEGPQTFSILKELTRIFFYSIPALALIWYLLFKIKGPREWGLIPGKKDVLPALITLPCLLLTGFTVAFVASRIGGTSAGAALLSPVTALEWIILCISCICAAYLEESFFRFYLLSRRKELNLNTSGALIISVALFSICHLYEGPWGFLNAVISGTLLAFIYLRYNSLHGVAIAHSVYNIFVFIINSLLS